MWSEQKTATPRYHRFRGIITKQLPAHNPVFQGEIEIDERYCGGRRKGKRGRGASGKTIVLGLYKRDGRVNTVSVCDTRTYTLYNIIKEKVPPTVLYILIRIIVMTYLTYRHSNIAGLIMRQNLQRIKTISMG